VNQARELPRESDFFEETSLPATARATLQDYHGSSHVQIDRGHRQYPAKSILI
jgi:endonuclease G